MPKTATHKISPLVEKNFKKDLTPLARFDKVKMYQTGTERREVKRNRMATTNAQLKETRVTQKSVFDLSEFDSILLKKMVDLPAKPKTIQEATAMCGNDTQKLLDVIYEGLVEMRINQARQDNSGWKLTNEDGSISDEDYTGNFADEDSIKLINAAVLNLSKINARGKWDSLDIDEKRKLKENVKEFLRKNPQMITAMG